MKLDIPPTKLLIAIFACTLSIVSTTDYFSIIDDADRIARNAPALPNSEFRRYIDVPETLHLVRRSVREDTRNTRVKHGRHRPVVLNVTGDHRDSADFEYPLEYRNIIKKSYLTNLHTADRLAENAVSIFGYILESPNSGLTLDQYSSLETIHNVIKRRQFKMYRLLHELYHLQSQPCISQFLLIMIALSAELPPYLACAANFLVSQIDLQLLDVRKMGMIIKDLNFLNGINEHEIAYGRSYGKQMEQNGYDDASRTTEAIVGPFFVHIFTLMSNHRLTVSQPLFASILLNLPNRDGDPIFNEYVRFVASIAWKGKIPNWSAKSYTPIADDDINFMIEAMVGTICRDPDVTYDIKQALWYIKNHFVRPIQDTVTLSAKEAYRASQDGVHFRELFDLITRHEFGPRAKRLKDDLTEYVASHKFVVQKSIAGMNLYGYTSPKQLLLAFLTRLRTRLPAGEIKIRESVSALLSILMVKRQTWNFYGLHEGGVTLWTLLDTINDSQTNPKMAELVQKILNELLGKFGLWSAISNMKLDYMKKCDSAEVCLREMLQNLVEHLPPDSLSPKTYAIIEELIDMITVEISRYSDHVVPERPFLCECPTTLQPYTAVTGEISHYHTTTVGPSTPATGKPHSEEPSVHYHTTTVGSSTPATGEPHSEEPSVHYHTTTVGSSTPEISEPHSEEPSVHYHTTTVGPSTPATGEPHSEEPSVHYHTTTVGSSTPEISEPHSEEPSVHYHTTTGGPSTPATGEPHSEEPSVHYHTTTVGSSTPEISEPHSKEPSVHYHTTTVGPSTPATGEPHSEEPSVHYHSTTVGSSTHSEEPSTHYHTTTVGPSTPATGEPHSEEPSVHYHTTTVGSSTHSEEPSIHYHTTTVGPSTPATGEPHSEEPSVHYHTTTVGSSTPEISEPHSEEPSVHHHTTTVGPSTPATGEPHSEEPSVHYHTTTVGSSTHSEEPSIHYHTTTVGPSTPATGEPNSEEPSVHYHTTTVGSSTHSEEPSIHYHTTTVGPSTPATGEPHSEEPSVHYHTTTVGSSTHSEEPSIHYHTTTVGPSTPATGEPHSEEPSVHYHTTTVGSSTPEISEPHSEEPSIHYHTTTVGPSTPATGMPHSEEPSVHYHTTTVGPSTPATREPHSEEPSVHYHTTTVRSSTPEISEPHSEEPSVHDHTTTIGSSTPEISEPHSEEPSVHYYTTTVGPSTPATGEPHSEEPSVHYHTTTVRSSTPEISEPHSEEPSVHYHTTTVGPSTPATGEPHSEEPSVHYHTTTVGSSTPEITEPHSEEPSVHYHTTTVGSSTPEISEPHSEEPSVHYHTTTVGPSTPATGEPHSEEPSVHYHTMMIGSPTPEISELHSEEPSVHYHTTTVGSSTPEITEPHSEEPSVHYHTTTIGSSTPEISEPHSGEPSVHYYTTTVGPSTPATGEPHSEESSVHYHTTTVGPSIPETREPSSEESSENYVSKTLAPSTNLVGISTEPTVHRPRENQTTENPNEYSISHTSVTQATIHYTTIAEPLITTPNGAISSVLPLDQNRTTEQPPTRFVPVLPPSVNPEEAMNLRVPKLGITPIKSFRIDENSDSSETVTIPSIVCLEDIPTADKFKGKCEKGMISITHILRRVFGEDYVQVLLGDDWRDRYPTRISFLVALLENAEKRDELSNQTNDLIILTRYKVALNFVTSYVLLPLIANSLNFTTRIVWLTYNAENPSECNIGSDRPHDLGENVLTLPLVNPAAWLLPVDTAHPFENLLPQLPPNNPYAVQIQPLTQLLNTGNIRDYLGSDWNPSQYPNRGALFISVLHILLKQESVQSDHELYDVVTSYVIAIERSPQYILIPRTYIDGVIRRYHELPEPTDRIVSPTNGRWSEESIQVVTSFVSVPLVQKLPSFVFPGVSIHVNVSYSGMACLESPSSPASTDIVMLPSFDCLLNKPRPEDNPESRCQKDLVPISQPLIHIFGADYIQKLLGDHWQILYPTRISLLVALLTAAERNEKCQANTELIAVINRYKAACEFVASYVLLPLVVDSQNLDTITVWSTFNYEYRWRSTIGIHEADGFGPNAVILPLINPKMWLTTVDINDPFAYLLPYQPENDPRFSKLQPLFSLFESGKIKKLLGSSWTPTDYPDRGSLFVSVLRTLLTLDVVTSDQQLHTLVSDYLSAIELPALYVHVPHSYVQMIFAQYNIPWMEEKYVELIKIPNHIPLPPLINPRKILQVIVPESGAPVIESVRSKKLQSKQATILPSVNCLQGASSADDDEAAGDTCDSVLEFRLTEPLIEALGDNYVEKILGADWGSLYPTRISFLAGLLRKAVTNEIILADPNQLHKKVTSFKEALEVAAPYIFLPMLANYQKLINRTVWLTYNYEEPWRSHMGRNRPQYESNSTVTLPLVNPKVWYLPVNRQHPFSGFLPDFPSTDPYEGIIAPLRSVLTLQYLRNLTGSEWEPSQYPNRGVFFVSAMHTLLKLGPTTMNPELYSLVRSYYMAIEIPSLYIHIPRSYINNAIHTAPGAWNVDLDGLMVALMEARSEEERRYLRILKLFLKHEGLLKELAIVLPSSTTTKHEFLLTIIRTALSSTTIQLTEDTIFALRACQSLILTTGAGAEVVGWIWVSRIIITTIIDLGTLVNDVIPIERVPEESRGAYYALLQYFEEHRTILVTEDFPAYRYHTSGTFLRGYLNHLVYKSRVSDEARENIELVIPYIRYTGPGAEPVPFANMVREQWS